MFVLIALLVLSGLVCLHELGHFLVARWLGIPVAVFSVGFGSTVIAKEWRGTNYRLGLLPLGGYVQFAEEGGASALESRPYWKKALVTIAGVVMNLLTAFVLLAILLWTGGRLVVGDGQAYESMVIEGRPFIEACVAAAFVTWEILSATLMAIPSAVVGVFTSAFTSPESSQMMGPVGITKVAAQSAEYGAISTMYFAALLSVGLAALNILPIMPLDGGHFLRYTAEVIVRRPLSPRIATVWSYAGLAIIAPLILLTLFSDIVRLFQ